MPSANGTNGNGVHANGHAVALTKPPALPKTWDRAKVDIALDLMAEGKSTRNACLDAGLKESTFRLWAIKDIDGLAAQYARAREAQMDAMESEILAIADDSQKDTTTRRDAQGNEYEVPDNEWIARSKLRVDARRWLMSKIAPKKYGDHSSTDVNVGGTGKSIVIEIDPNRNHRRVMDADRAERRPLELEANGDS